MYQLHQLIFMRVCVNLLLQCVAKQVKALHRHHFEAWVRRSAVIHG